MVTGNQPTTTFLARIETTVDYQPAGRQRYTLTRLYAQGGIGQVRLAHDDDLGRGRGPQGAAHRPRPAPRGRGGWSRKGVLATCRLSSLVK